MRVRFHCLLQLDEKILPLFPYLGVGTEQLFELIDDQGAPNHLHTLGDSVSKRIQQGRVKKVFFIFNIQAPEEIRKSQFRQACKTWSIHRTLNDTTDKVVNENVPHTAGSQNISTYPPYWKDLIPFILKVGDQAGINDRTLSSARLGIE